MTQYTRVDSGGRIYMETHRAHSALIRDDKMYVRPTKNIVRIDSEGRIFVTAPVIRTPPKDPDSEASVG